MQVKKIMKKYFGATSSDFVSINLGGGINLLFMNSSLLTNLDDFVKKQPIYASWFDADRVAQVSLNSDNTISVLLSSGSHVADLSNKTSFTSHFREKVSDTNQASGFQYGVDVSKGIYVTNANATWTGAFRHSSSDPSYLECHKYYLFDESLSREQKISIERQNSAFVDLDERVDVPFTISERLYLNGAHPNGFTSSNYRTATGDAAAISPEFSNLDGMVLVEGPTILGRFEILINQSNGNVMFSNQVAGSAVADRMEAFADLQTNQAQTIGLRSEIAKIRDVPDLVMGVISTYGWSLVKSCSQLSTSVKSIRNMEGIVDGVNFDLVNETLDASTGSLQYYVYQTGDIVDKVELGDSTFVLTSEGVEGATLKYNLSDFDGNLIDEATNIEDLESLVSRYIKGGYSINVGVDETSEVVNLVNSITDDEAGIFLPGVNTLPDNIGALLVSSIGTRTSDPTLIVSFLSGIVLAEASYDLNGERLTPAEEVVTDDETYDDDGNVVLSIFEYLDNRDKYFNHVDIVIDNSVTDDRLDKHHLSYEVTRNSDRLSFRNTFSGITSSGVTHYLDAREVIFLIQRGLYTTLVDYRNTSYFKGAVQEYFSGLDYTDSKYNFTRLKLPAKLSSSSHALGYGDYVNAEIVDYAKTTNQAQVGIPLITVINNDTLILGSMGYEYSYVRNDMNLSSVITANAMGKTFFNFANITDSGIKTAITNASLSYGKIGDLLDAVKSIFNDNGKTLYVAYYNNGGGYDRKTYDAWSIQMEEERVSGLLTTNNSHEFHNDEYRPLTSQL